MKTSPSRALKRAPALTCLYDHCKILQVPNPGHGDRVRRVHKDFELIMQACLVGARFEARDEQVLMVPMVYVTNLSFNPLIFYNFEGIHDFK